MIDFAAARRMMVDGQVRTSDVTDRRLIGAMLQARRERFLPPEKAELAYLDLDVPVTAPAPGVPARRLIKPMVLAKLIQAAEIESDDHVLDVGCATGYSTAVLAQLARQVTGLEQDAALIRLANDNLRKLGVANARVETVPLLTKGFPPQAPYDAILINGASEIVPEALLAQLRQGGRLVCVLGRVPATKAMLYRAVGGEFSGRPIFDAAASLLPGFAAPPAFVF